MSVKLFSFWKSSCAWRVRICLALKGVEYEVIPVNLYKEGGGEHLEPKYRSVNPMGQVPAFVDGDLVLSQSMAIMEYLDDKYGGYPLLPKDFVLKAKAREICEVICSGIQPLQNMKALERMGGDFNKNEAARNCIESGFQSLEKLLSKSSGKYCVGDDITMADACLVPQVANAQRFNVNMEQFPVITRIMALLLQQKVVKDSHPNLQPDCPNK